VRPAGFLPGHARAAEMACGALLTAAGVVLVAGLRDTALGRLLPLPGHVTGPDLASQPRAPAQPRTDPKGSPMLRSPARLVTASLLLASAAAFAAGVTIERTTASSESHRVEQHADAGTHTTPAAGAATATTPSAHALPVPGTTTKVAVPTPGQARGGDGDSGETGTTSPAEATPGSDEHSSARTATTTPSPGVATTAQSPAGDGDNGGPAAASEPAAGGEPAAAHAAESQSENLLGINPEATGLVVIAVALSLLLAALILTAESPLVAAGIAVTMLAFTVLDIREVTHQLNESRSGLAALAAVVALLHMLAAVSALLTARAPRGRAGGTAA